MSHAMSCPAMCSWPRSTSQVSGTLDDGWYPRWSPTVGSLFPNRLLTWMRCQKPVSVLSSELSINTLDGLIAMSGAGKDLMLSRSSADFCLCLLLRLLSWRLLDLVLPIFKSIGLFMVRRFVLDWCILRGYICCYILYSVLGGQFPKYFSYFYLYFLFWLTNLLKQKSNL
jgi:hypothetical protein